MKSDLSCEVVRDLLPSYIDGLTSEETSRLIRAHLDGCEACRGIHREMTNEEPPKAEQPEVDYLKKVRASGKRLRRMVIIAGCAVLALAVAAVLISRASKRQAAADAYTITALQETEEALKKQMELPTVLYDAETGVLVVTGTGDYDQAAPADTFLQRDDFVAESPLQGCGSVHGVGLDPEDLPGEAPSLSSRIFGATPAAHTPTRAPARWWTLASARATSTPISMRRTASS